MFDDFTTAITVEEIDGKAMRVTIIERTTPGREVLLRLVDTDAILLAALLQRDASAVGRSEWFAARNHGLQQGLTELEQLEVEFRAAIEGLRTEVMP